MSAWNSCGGPESAGERLHIKHVLPLRSGTAGVSYTIAASCTPRVVELSAVAPACHLSCRSPARQLTPANVLKSHSSSSDCTVCTVRKMTAHSEPLRMFRTSLRRLVSARASWETVMRSRAH